MLKSDSMTYSNIFPRTDDCQTSKFKKEGNQFYLERMQWCSNIYSTTDFIDDQLNLSRNFQTIMITK